MGKAYPLESCEGRGGSKVKQGFRTERLRFGNAAHRRFGSSTDALPTTLPPKCPTNQGNEKKRPAPGGRVRWGGAPDGATRVGFWSNIREPAAGPGAQMRASRASKQVATRSREPTGGMQDVMTRGVCGLRCVGTCGWGMGKAFDPCTPRHVPGIRLLSLSTLIHTINTNTYLSTTFCWEVT